MIIVFFGELSTKGKNIMNFIRLLGANIKIALKKFTSLSYEIKKDHIYILLNGESFEEVSKPLKKVPGILSFSLATRIDKDINKIKEEAFRQYQDTKPTTFKIHCKRIDKTFPLHSDEVNRQVAGYILSNVGGKVDVHHPELLLNIIIREEGCYIYGKKIQALGGYPLGIAGKGLALLSGGIDSPVSIALLMKRGVRVECIHFMAPPYTSSLVIDKIKDLLHVLNDYQDEIKLYLVPFTDLEKKIYEVAGPSYCVTIMRRMMMRISSIMANKHNDLIVSTGESIGQVASQTLYSMKVIDPCCKLPVIRPLATYDKSEIIRIAQEIGTYSTSIRPYEDCCTIFPLKDPVTHPNIEVVEKIENSFDYNQMIYDCIRNIEVIHVKKEDDEF